MKIVLTRYSNYHRLQLANDFYFIQSDWKNLVSKNQQINMIKKNKDDFTVFKPQEKVSGMVTFALTNEEFERMKTVKPKYIIEGGVADNESLENSYLQNSPSYDFIYSDEQSKQVASQTQFYQDRLSSDNWADKKMFFEKNGINETKQIGDVKVTLDDFSILKSSQLKPTRQCLLILVIKALLHKRSK